MNCTSRCVYTYTAVQEVSVTDIDMTLGVWPSVEIDVYKLHCYCYSVLAVQHGDDN